MAGLGRPIPSLLASAIAAALPSRLPIGDDGGPAPGYALVFDGSTAAAARMPTWSASVDGDFDIVAEVQVDTTVFDARDMWLLGTYSTFWVNDLSIRYHRTNGWQVMVGGGNSGFVTHTANLGGLGVVDSAKFYELRFKRRGTSVSLEIDGVLINTATVAGLAGFTPVCEGFLGGVQTGANNFAGKIKSIGFYDIAAPSRSRQFAVIDGVMRDTVDRSYSSHTFRGSVFIAMDSLTAGAALPSAFGVWSPDRFFKGSTVGFAGDMYHIEATSDLGTIYELRLTEQIGTDLYSHHNNAVMATIVRANSTLIDWTQP